jgi:hypothetical protein
MRAIHLVATAALLIAPATGAFAAGTSATGGTTEGQAATAAGSGQGQAAPATGAETTVTVQPQGKCPSGQAPKAGGGCQP